MAKAPTDIRSLARAHTTVAIKTLQGIMTDASAPQAARVRAAEALLDRGWGKPTQCLEIEDRRTHEDAVKEMIGESVPAVMSKDTETRGNA